MKMPPLLYLEWLDHCSGSYGWREPEDYDAETVLCKTVGWVMAETDEAITLAQSSEGGGKFSGEFIVVKSCIKRRVKLQP